MICCRKYLYFHSYLYLYLYLYLGAEILSGGKKEADWRLVERDGGMVGVEFGASY